MHISFYMYVVICIYVCIACEYVNMCACMCILLQCLEWKMGYYVC